MPRQSLFMAVVDRGRAEDVLKELRVFGLGNAVVLFGEGTIANKFLEILGLDETQKEVIILTVSERFEDAVHELMLKAFKIHRKRRGIAFSMPLSRYRQDRYQEADERVPKSAFPYHCIISITNHGKSKDVVRVAREAGAPGATIVRGRGAGIPQTGSFFDLLVEPQKDIVFCLVPTDQAIFVKRKIAKDLNFSKPGEGILFVLPVKRASGLYQSKEGQDERSN